MDVRLYQAALSGDTSLLTKWLEDSQLLDQAPRDCSAKNNPLHIAARLGHFNFVREILTLQPRFARELNSQGQAPLHLASAKGHSKVVKELLQAYPDACFLHDRDGTTPLHRAAMKGRVEVLEELVGANPETAWLLTDKGDPVLHLCVHHNQFEALKTLVEKVGSVEFLNLKDEDDNTVLHLLAAKNQYKVMKFLLTNHKDVDVNAVNVDGSTALDVSRGNPSGSNHWKIRVILKSFGAKKARKISPTRPKKWAKKTQDEKYQTWFSKMKESLMVVAVLMASMAFQVALNPPGGVWQDDGYHNKTLENLHDDPNDPGRIPHRAGEAIISYQSPSGYKAITISTGLGLLASLSLILLLVSGFSFQQKISIWMLMVTTWIAVASIMVTYLVSYTYLTSREIIGHRKFWLAAPCVVLVWVLLICIMFSIHICRFVRRLLQASGMVLFYKFFMKLF